MQQILRAGPHEIGILFFLIPLKSPAVKRYRVKIPLDLLKGDYQSANRNSTWYCELLFEQHQLLRLVEASCTELIEIDSA